MPLSPEVKQVVDALGASARGQMAASAGLEKVDDRLKDVEEGLGELRTEIHDLVEEMKEQNIIERTGHEHRVQSERERWAFLRELLDRLGHFFNSRPMWALYMLVGLIVANAFGISPQTVSAFFSRILTPGAAVSQ